MVFEVLEEIFARLHQKFYKLQRKVFKFNPHHRAGGQPTSQECQCHLICMHSIRVGCFVQTLRLSTLCSLGVRVFLSCALHRSKQELEVCDANGARSVHVGLEYALCSRCMCLIEAFTRCDPFPVL